MGADKTAVMSFQDGFSFLGEGFGPRYPPAIEEGGSPSRTARSSTLPGREAE